MNGVLRFGKAGKLSPHYISVFEIVERIGNMAYKLALPANMYAQHNVFLISSQRKFILYVHSKIIMEPVEIQLELTYVEEHDHIFEFSVKQLRSRDIQFIKVLWKHGYEKEITREK
ncbi:uncharacterized protein LOC110113355 [Dendrobium catenatum]|uniref:uncharacterized protein LOC110113355 n=1 Tax=Dendrobium catenatum TaxID=906689 RepID=UPI0009F4BD0F|nr:uncharacterized protein LOC110113355 [Dendrobium catenatum]